MNSKIIFALILGVSFSTTAFAAPEFKGKPNEIGKECVKWATKETDSIKDEKQKSEKKGMKIKECLLKNKLDPSGHDLTDPDVKKALHK